MQELGFSEDEIPMLADKAFADPQTIGNPRDVDARAYRRIYQQAFDAKPMARSNGATK
jgi:choline dehydrogenase